jgi:hypothetical protein
MELSTELRAKLKKLPEKKKTELLKFVDYLQVYEDSSFIEYINERTQQAVQEKKNGKHFTSLEELQREYA